jgi:hypothetical protein
MTLVFRPGYITTFADPDVQAYLTAVEEADNASLEYPVAYAIDEFVRGCKADGIWNAIKASCILAGARTLTGALVPLVGTAPTSFNFVDADYNRKTGLVGNGSTKYLNSNRGHGSDPRDNNHLSIFTQPDFNDSYVIGATVFASSGAVQSYTAIQLNAGNVSFFSRNRSFDFSTMPDPAPARGGFYGISRNATAAFAARTGNSSSTFNVNSFIPEANNYFIHARSTTGGNPASYSNARIAFYSIGESLDLALLDARVTDLINTFERVIS